MSSLPINPFGVDSDAYEEDETSSSSPLSSSSRRSSLSEPLLSTNDRDKAVIKSRIALTGRVFAAVAKVLCSTAMSHFAPGTGGTLNISAAISTQQHAERLKELKELQCDVQKDEICKGLLAYVISQKDEAFADAIVKCTPVLGTIQAVLDKFHWLDKKLVGVAGETRNAQATLLVEHAKECQIALAIYAEVVCKDSTKKQAWQRAYDEVTTRDVVWGDSDQNPVFPAADSAARKTKPTS